MAHLSKRPAPRRQQVIAVLAIYVAASTLMTVAVRVPKQLIWNASASVPVGLYRMGPATRLQTGHLVVTRLPPSILTLASQRQYLPANVPLIKPVMAVETDTVCRWKDKVFVNGAAVGTALRSDRVHRPMPRWQGCQTLSPNQLFVMNPSVPDSFDGRYFGPIERHMLLGRAYPIYIDWAGNGQFSFRPTSHTRARN